MEDSEESRKRKESEEIPIIDIDGISENRLTKKEYTFLQELKIHKGTKDYNDKLLMIFGFSRKLDIKRTLELLINNKKWMTEHGYNWKNPITASQCNQQLMAIMYSFSVPKKYYKECRAIGYLFHSRIIFFILFDVLMHFSKFYDQGNIRCS
jgi:hypothetical protein